MAEIGLALLKDERYDESIDAIQFAIKSTTELFPELYMNLGSALEKSGDSLRAIEVYDQGLQLFPHHPSLHFNKALSLFNGERFEETIEVLKFNLETTPKHAPSHLLLGTMAAQEGEIVQAMLSLNMFLILEPFSSNAGSAISLLESIAINKIDLEEMKGIKFPAGDDYSEIELLLANKIALNKKYKVKGGLATYDIVKQNHLLFEKLVYDESDKGFWMQFYVPFFIQLFESGQFEGFTYLIFAGIDEPSIQTIVKKNLSKAKAFNEWWPSAWYDQHKMHTYILAGKKQEVQYWYSENDKLNLIGNTTTKGKTTMLAGPFEAFHDNGNLKAKGQFNDEGLKSGTCYYYDEHGFLTDMIHFVDDYYDGQVKTFYQNGNVFSDLTYSMGELNGEAKIYFLHGGLMEEKNFEKGKLSGKYITYYTNGSKEYVAEYKDGLIEGKLLVYYRDGNLYSETEYKEGKAHGNYKVYFRDGTLATDEKYVDGLLEGPYVQYYSNGKISLQGTAKAGTDINEVKSFYIDGNLAELTTYDETGKLNGIKKSYARDGKLNFEWDYSKGEITGYRYYAKDGSIISEGKRKLTKFPFTGYFDDGIKRFEGNYEGSVQNGTWKYYDRFGNLSSELEFKKGLEEGKQTYYFENGEIKTKIMYKSGIREGYYENYYINGQLKEEGWYGDDNLKGVWKNYYWDGTLKSVSFYDGGQKGWQTFYDELGKIDTRSYLENGFINILVFFDTSGVATDTINFQQEKVVYKEPDFAGNLHVEGLYQNGRSNGIFKWYGPNQKVIIEGLYVDGEQDGNWKWYNTEGTLTMDGFYDNGSFTGQWKNYYNSGELSLVRNYFNGIQEGEMFRYYKNGQIETKGNYQNDEKIGEFYYYDPTGELQIIRYFSENKIVGYSYLGADGKPIPMIPVLNGTGKITAFYKNGKKSLEYSLDRGLFNGLYNEYYANGKLYIEATYKDDNLEGIRKVYYQSGKLQTEGNYNFDNKYGIVNEYAENGQLIESANYINDDYYGERKFYKAGKLVKTILYYNDKIVKEY